MQISYPIDGRWRSYAGGTLTTRLTAEADGAESSLARPLCWFSWLPEHSRLLHRLDDPAHEGAVMIREPLFETPHLSALVAPPIPAGRCTSIVRRPSSAISTPLSSGISLSLSTVRAVRATVRLLAPPGDDSAGRDRPTPAATLPQSCDNLLELHVQQ